MEGMGLQAGDELMNAMMTFNRQIADLAGLPRVVQAQRKES